VKTSRAICIEVRRSVDCRVAPPWAITKLTVVQRRFLPTTDELIERSRLFAAETWARLGDRRLARSELGFERYAESTSWRQWIPGCARVTAKHGTLPRRRKPDARLHQIVLPHHRRSATAQSRILETMKCRKGLVCCGAHVAAALPQVRGSGSRQKQDLINLLATGVDG
jgi:hypothetical protein